MGSKKLQRAELNSVFVYGTLQQGQVNHGIIAPFCQEVRPAILQGLLYDLPYGYPAAVDGDGVIKGEVVELRHVRQALAALDKLEDYYGPGCAGNMYDRVVREAILADGSKAAVYVYLWNKPHELAGLGAINPQGEWPVNTGPNPH